MNAAGTPEVLVLITLVEPWHDELEREFTLRYVARAADRAAAIRECAPGIRAIITNGTTGTSRELIGELPRLELIACFSAGYENVDLAAARERGIPVTTAIGANADAVADLGVGLMLAVQREIALRDRQLRAGRWADIRVLTHTLTGKRLGLLGFGQIGRAIARRARGFDMAIAYTKPTLAPDADARYVATVAALAAESDFLVVCCPGGPATRHLVDAKVLAALGREGYLVNISRGSVVDTAALVAALERGAIAGAALDVYENEPEVPDALKRLDNVVLMPHVAGFTHESFRRAFELMRENLRAHFAGRALPTPVRPVSG
jgi:hydroxypyruvate reductase